MNPALHLASVAVHSIQDGAVLRLLAAAPPYGDLRAAAPKRRRDRANGVADEPRVPDVG